MPILRSTVALVVGLAVGSWCWSDEPRVPEHIRQLMQDRDFEAAVRAIDQIDRPGDGDLDYLAYLKGRALHFQQKYDEAVASFDLMQRKFPDSPWARRARFAAAVSHARKGDFRAAEQIYRAEAEHVLSAGRKQSVADIYLEFADAFFKPAGDPEKKPDYQKALEFYQQALQVGPLPDKRIQIELLIAQCQQHLGNYAAAIPLLTKFIQEHGEHELVIEARFRLGDCQLAAGDMVAARRTWQDLLELHSTSESPRMPEASFNLARTHHFPTPGNAEQLSLGVAALESFLQRFPDHKLASQAHLWIGKGYQHRRRQDDAARAFQRFLADQRYQQSEELPEATYLLGNALNMQRKFDEALEIWRSFLARYPTHQAWSTVQQEIVNTEYVKALAQYQDKQYATARQLWSEFLVRYPLDQRARTILYMFGAMNYAEEKWDDAVADWRKLVSKYPQTEESSRAQFMVAAVLEEKLGRLEEALEEYRKVTWGSFAPKAESRIARLTAKSLKIATERVFRSDETPVLKLDSRNIDAVSVRVYSVDLETYFRKMHLARGVEQLDISLIDPDHEFEFKVPEYEPFQRFESQIEIPLPKAEPKAGVMAVTVSGKTLEATTLVLQSDLDIVVKSSRDELLVFAENMRTGRPWGQVRVLVSNGSQVFAQGQCGDDGVYHSALEQLKSTDDVRVFAVAGGHVASNVVDLSGVGVAEGLTDKGYIYTDRPAYRPGQRVHIRGVLRKVAADTFTVASDKAYQVDVLDNRDRPVFDTQIKLNEFGSFHTTFVLPAVSPQGQYRVRVHQDDRENYQGTFLVHDYQLEPVRLEVDTPRNVYYRGEEIEGTIKAAFYYGAPLVDREIRYQLAGGRSYTAKTDQNGEVPFKLPTRDFRETQTLPLVVTLPERNVQGGKNFFLATQGFTLDVQTVRDVYLAGETFEVNIHARDAEGEPLVQPLTLQVVQQTRVGSRVGEVVVQKHELQTDAEGTARQTLSLPEGGQYVLRAEGIDRFQNAVSRESSVHISDDSDATRLRILAEQHTFRVGDVANVDLHWRESPALALVTFQGARILDYQLVELQTGKNTLAIPMSVKLAPNFDLSVAVMTNARPKEKQDSGADAQPALPRFHEASSPFTVQRELTVQLEVMPVEGGPKPPRPGDAVEVVVTATDPQGKPVRAELSLALVEKPLMDRFQFELPAIGQFFRDVERQSAMRTTSSVTFSYRPQTRTINPLLLAEIDRRELAEEEERRLAALRGDGEMPGTESGYAPSVASSEAGGAAGVDFYAVLDLIQSTGEDAGILPGLDNSRGTVPSYHMQSQIAQFTDGVSQSNLSLFAGQSENVQVQPMSGPERRLPGVAALLAGDVARWGYAAGNGVTDAPSPRAWFALDQQNADELSGLLQGNKLGIQVLSRDGTVHNVNIADLGENETQELVAQLADAGAQILPLVQPQETGYWNPAVVTDERGEARLTVTLPERSTAWKWLAKGITVDTLAGEAEDELAVKKSLFGELKLPAAFTDGDVAQVAVSVHNEAIDKGTILVDLKSTIGDKTISQRQRWEAPAKGIHELVFEQPIQLPEGDGASSGTGPAVEFELTVSAEEITDVVRQSVPIRPYGVPVYSIEGGSASGDVTAIVTEPAGMKLQSPQLEILIGPTVERSLMDVLFGTPVRCQLESGPPASGVDSAASDLMAGLALQSLVAATRDAGTPQAESLDARVRSAISLLVSLQNDDGGWSWAGRKGGSSRYTSARVVWALSLAKKAGYRIADEGYAKALLYVQSQLAESRVADYETKAVLLHALSAAGQGDFPLANQLYRNRNSLSAAGLAHLALAFAALDRQQTASELLELLGGRELTASPKRTSGTLAWNQSVTEVRALYALALDQVLPRDARLREQVDWLMAHRTGHRWSPDKATGPAMQAVCHWFARTRFQGEKYQLSIVVNDRLVKELEIDDRSLTQTVVVPPALLDKEKQRVRLELAGRGRFTYQCVLGGFVPGDRLKSTTPDWKVERFYEPAPLEMDGREIPRGFDVLRGSYSTFRNELHQLPVGRRGRVELRITRQNVPSNTPEEQLPYLVISEPLPAGATVIEQSVQGEYERFEIVSGAITFYLGTRTRFTPISYEMHGYLSGAYQVTPTLVRDAYQPDQIAVAAPRRLAVLPIGSKSEDAYRLSPRELLELGKYYFEHGDLAGAAARLTELIQNWNLQPEPYRDTVRMLLDIHLRHGPPTEVVRYFEIIIEKYPELEIPFAKLLEIGDAYHQIGEYERGYLVYRATVEASFLRESRVAGFLEAQQEFLRSVDVMSGFIREYPPEPYVATATYALAQRVYAKAPEAAADQQLRERKITRVDLVRQALAMLDNFLADQPLDPAADEASFSLANALLELQLYDKAIEMCRKYARRFADSDFLDSYWYIIGYCHYARGEHTQALDMCQKVADATRQDRTTGRTVESPNKWRALYIMGQIYHSLGKAEEAIRQYKLVQDQFVDARQAIDYFAHKQIELPEVETFKPGEAVRVELKYRNVPACNTTVYRIDLMKFSLLQRNLERITGINLAGIRPYFVADIQLGDGKDYRDRTRMLELPLKDAGAYLVVCRGENLYASGMVLVTPLEVEVQQEVDSGRVRITVRDTVTNRYQSEVHVKVIGTRNSDFISGKTDLRGVFVADGIQGRSMVIAQADGASYAFYRGSLELGPPPQPAANAAQAADQPVADADSNGESANVLLKGLQEGNRDIQLQNQKQLKEIYDNTVDEGIGGGFGGGVFK